MERQKVLPYLWSVCLLGLPANDEKIGRVLLKLHLLLSEMQDESDH